MTYLQIKKRLGLAVLQHPSVRSSVPVLMERRELSVTSSAQTRADLAENFLMEILKILRLLKFLLMLTS